MTDEILTTDERKLAFDHLLERNGLPPLGEGLALERIQEMVLRPRDVIVATMPPDATNDDLRQMYDTLRAIFPANSVVVKWPTVTLEVVSPEDAPETDLEEFHTEGIERKLEEGEVGPRGYEQGTPVRFWCCTCGHTSNIGGNCQGTEARGEHMPTEMVPLTET